jgi:hypothetical protein
MLDASIFLKFTQYTTEGKMPQLCFWTWHTINNQAYKDFYTITWSIQKPNRTTNSTSIISGLHNEWGMYGSINFKPLNNYW